MPLIELQHITKTFEAGDADFKALDDVSLSIEPGEFVAIMGPSGSGKSTLMNIVGLLDRPTSGTYVLEGKPVSLKMSDREQARLRSEFVGFIFQNFNLLANVDVLENVALPALYARHPSYDRRGRAKALLQQVGLSHRLQYRPSKLSGGEKQRVAIARALMNNPKVVLADEPTGNLDSKSGKEVISILKNLNTKGTTLLLVTHSEELAAAANRIVRLKDGRIVL
ncbi:MAG: ABC transporter ATP-binding protein [Candidatus Kerfeldbacteria bacterium]|nr:ABC transporter ATP-binding protein [Candidatus Kerfeldbacteria bacterium]